MWATAEVDELKAVTDQIGSGVLVVEVCGNRCFRILSINSRIEQTAGLRHTDISGLTFEELLCAPVAEQMTNHYQHCVDKAQRYEYEENLDLPSGRVWWQTILTPITNASGRIVRLLASTVDFTERHQLEIELRQTAKALRESESRLYSAIKGARLGIWDWDIPARRIWMADDWARSLRTFEVPTPLSSGEWAKLIHPESRAEAIEAGERVIRGETDTYSVEYQFWTSGSGWRWRHAYGTVTEYDAAGKPSRICGTSRDISQQKKDQEELHRLTVELEHRATHDSLTGALNRGAVLEELEKEIARAQREDTSVTVALIDVDYFKPINDSYGHQAGDEALRELVARIHEVLRPYDHLGRYGGEEFIVITQVGKGTGDLHERIRATVASAPFPTSAGQLDVTVSIGVATRTDATADELILQADQALYQAKRAGRNRVIKAEQTACL